MGKVERTEPLRDEGRTNNWCRRDLRWIAASCDECPVLAQSWHSLSAAGGLLFGV